MGSRGLPNHNNGLLIGPILLLFRILALTIYLLCQMRCPTYT